MLAAAAVEVSSFSSSCYTPPITSTTNDSLGFVCLFVVFVGILNFDHFTTLCQQLRQQIFIWNMKYLLRFRAKSPEIWKNEELDLKICRPCVTIQHLVRSGSVTVFTFITDCFIGITDEILPFHHSPIFPTYRHYWFHNGWMQRYRTGFALFRDQVGFALFPTQICKRAGFPTKICTFGTRSSTDCICLLMFTGGWPLVNWSSFYWNGIILQ